MPEAPKQEGASTQAPEPEAGIEPEPVTEEKPEDEIDLSGVTWDVEGLDNGKPEPSEPPKRSRLHFFKHN